MRFGLQGNDDSKPGKQSPQAQDSQGSEGSWTSVHASSGDEDEASYSSWLQVAMEGGAVNQNTSLENRTEKLSLEDTAQAGEDLSVQEQKSMKEKSKDADMEAGDTSEQESQPQEPPCSLVAHHQEESHPHSNTNSSSGMPDADMHENENRGARTNNDSLSSVLSHLPQSFMPPTDIMYADNGCLEEAVALGKLSHRPVFVSLQNYDDGMGSNIVNRDIFRNEIFVDLVRSKFIFCQTTSDSREGKAYIRRFKVRKFPHIGIIHPNHYTFIWGKEGWKVNDPWDLIEILQAMTDICFERYTEAQLAMDVDFDPQPVHRELGCCFSF